MNDAEPVVARGLVKRYGDIVAVAGVDLTVGPGDIFGYLGPNGAGKTTSLRMMLGLIRPSDGSVELFGRDPLTDGAKALVGFSPFQFEGFLHEVGEPAAERVLPPPLTEAPDIARLIPIAVRNGFDILGPPGPPPGH